jgi:hypothetical protein
LTLTFPNSISVALCSGGDVENTFVLFPGPFDGCQNAVVLPSKSGDREFKLASKEFEYIFVISMPLICVEVRVNKFARIKQAGLTP